METIIKVKVEKLENGEHLVTSKELPDLIVQGRTIAEVLEIASDVARKLYESYLDRNIKLPAVFKKAKSNGPMNKLAANGHYFGNLIHLL